MWISILVAIGIRSVRKSEEITWFAVIVTNFVFYSIVISVFLQYQCNKYELN